MESSKPAVSKCDFSETRAKLTLVSPSSAKKQAAKAAEIKQQRKVKLQAVAQRLKELTSYRK